MKHIKRLLIYVATLSSLYMAGETVSNAQEADTLAIPEGYMLADSVAIVPSPRADLSLQGKDIFSVMPSKDAGDAADVRINQSGLIRNSLENHIRGNAGRTIDGYRVRIFFDNRQSARSDSEEMEKKFSAAHPDIPVYRSYVNPYFKVTVGDFRTKSEAMMLLRSIVNEFPTAFVVKENINQTIKLIELPTQELEQRIRKELEENPVLDENTSNDRDEEEDGPREVSLSDYKEDDSIPSYKLRVNNYGKDERPQYNTFSVKESFTQSLMDQLGFRNLTEHQHAVAAFIIGSLDDDGYLRRSIESLVDDLAFRAGIETDEKEVTDMLKIIQEFDPAGVGARDLRECLLLQIRTLKQTPEVINATKILTDYFTEFTNKHFQKIIARMGITEEEMKAAMAKILKLNPSPGGQIDDSYNDQAQQIVPDFVLTLENGDLKLTMPRFSIPELRVNKKYADILMEAANSSEREKKEAATFVKKKLDSAKWFVEAIKQRHNTLESTMKAIIDYQHDYFMDGDESHLKPMVLKDIAERTGFDISTISRVVNSKYIETHFGIYSLKYFFSEGLENQEGEEVSTRELKKALQECVDNEDKHHPLTDDQLVSVMSSKGYKVARRTIAKYRDQLNIPKARLRKEL